MYLSASVYSSGKLRALGAKIDCVEENDEPPIRQIG